MSKLLPDLEDDPRSSPVKYRLQFKSREGLRVHEEIIVCQNFRVTLDERLFYTDLNGDIRGVILRRGDLFLVSVMR